MNIEKVVAGKVNSLFVKRLIASKGWTKQQAAYYVMDFLYGGTKKSFYDFMNECE